MSKLEKICAAFFVALILCWMTFDNLIGIRFTNYDDMWFSVVSFKDYFAVAGEIAINKDFAITGQKFAILYVHSHR